MFAVGSWSDRGSSITRLNVTGRTSGTGSRGDGPYERLAVIYRRRKDHASEVAILERAVEVFEALMARSPRVDVPIKLAKFRERCLARRLVGEGT